MRWKVGRRSSNVEDARRGGSGMRLGGAGGLGLGGVAVVVVLSLLTGQNPGDVLSMITGAGPAEQHGPPPEGDENAEFVRAILGETEDVWGQLFQQAGQRYDAPRLVLFSRAVRSGCGGATAATGPFYCPADQKVYLDFSFFQDMESKLGGGGDFANAYVIAHEVGHHVQNVLGVFAESERAAGRGADTAGATGLSVRQELQADCFAGVWAHHAQARHQWLEAGDLEEALRTASAIGDDRLQRQQQGEVVPDSFTHGTSAQRVRWFKQGFGDGKPDGCDTFAARQL